MESSREKLMKCGETERSAAAVRAGMISRDTLTAPAARRANIKGCSSLSPNSRFGGGRQHRAWRQSDGARFPFVLTSDFADFRAVQIGTCSGSPGSASGLRGNNFKTKNKKQNKTRPAPRGFQYPDPSHWPQQMDWLDEVGKYGPGPWAYAT
jgi:hypothetical protein